MIKDENISDEDFMEKLFNIVSHTDNDVDEEETCKVAKDLQQNQDCFQKFNQLRNTILRRRMPFMC